MHIEFHRSFKKRYKKIPARIRDRFDERLRLFELEPFNALINNHPLTGERAGEWSINVTGDWRALYEFTDSDTVIFLDIDTHSNLYK